MSDIALERPNVAAVEVQEPLIVPVGLIVLCAVMLFIGGYGLGNLLAQPGTAVSWGAFLGGTASGIFLAVYLIFAPGRVEMAEFHSQDKPESPRSVSVVKGDDVRQVPITTPSKTVYNAGFKYTFSPRQVDKFLQWIEAGDLKIRRDDSVEGPGLRIGLGIDSQTYGPLILALQANGYITDSKEWTDEGIAWLEREPSPTPDWR
jgi:hypothetical protein